MARRIAAAVCMLVLLIAAVPGNALAKTQSVIRLPKAIERIGADAFDGIDIDLIAVPEGVERLGARFFAGTRVKEIQLPKSLRQIDERAFEGCEGVVLRVMENSYAHLWCVDKGIDFKLTGSGVMLEAAGVPAYWKRHMNIRIKDIFAALEAAGENRSAFFWYTDSHWSGSYRRSPMILRYLSANTPISKTNFGGDILDLESGKPEEMAYLFNWRKSVDTVPNHHSIVGNHDDGNGSGIEDGSLSVEYIRSFLMAGESSANMVRGDKFYYYIDDAAEKTRYIYLDTATRYHSFGKDAAQRAFLKKALKSAKDGWHIVVLSHLWQDVDYTPGHVGANGFSWDASLVLQELDAYNARGGEYGKCGARVEFCIGGHTHVDGDYVSPGGIPVVITEGDSRQVRGGLQCVPGTITEAAVSAVIADYDGGKLHIIRIGRGESRVVPLAGK